MLTTTAAGRTWDFSHALGAFTTEGEGFLHPSDLAIGGDGTIYVVSRGQFATMDTQISKNRLRITKLNLDEVFLGEFGTGHFPGLQVWRWMLTKIYIVPMNLII